ncbi:MAG TPA: methyltransferase domain-containing protein [Armatimonadota bacterium]|nr:methyltransferase domain-containing protein [Armatimonadota bacterium]
MASVSRKVKDLIPQPMRDFLRMQHRAVVRYLTRQEADLGSMHRCTPIAREFGRHRGEPIDRYYIEKFLSRYRDDIAGRVLEVADATYTRRFGRGRVTTSDVLHVSETKKPVTITADLTDAPSIPSETFDCIILTQTLQFIYDIRAAVGTLHRILKPNGVLLLTVPGIAPISPYDQERWGEYWRFTSGSTTRLLTEAFHPQNITLEAFGNILVAVSFLHGLAREDLTTDELDFKDPLFEFLITARAVKAR